MIVESGRGTPHPLGVDSNGHALTNTIAKSEDFHQNLEHQESWSVSFQAIDPTAADDYFFYFKNLGTKIYAISSVRIKSTVAGVVEIHRVSGTATSTNAIIPVNRFLGSPPIIVGTIGTNVDITGITNQGHLAYIDLDAANKQYHIDLQSRIIIPPGESLSFLWDTSTGILSGFVSFLQVEPEVE